MPSVGKKCLNCGNFNHFAAHCRGKPSRLQKLSRATNIHPLDTNNSMSPDEGDCDNSSADNPAYCYAMQNNRKKPEARILIEGQECTVIVDTGASIT